VGDSNTEGAGRPFTDEPELDESLRFNAQDQAFMERAAQRENIVEIHPILKLIFQGYAGLLILAAGAAWIAVMAVIVVGLVELAQRV
jgi:hypothetical protein